MTWIHLTRGLKLRPVKSFSTVYCNSCGMAAPDGSIPKPFLMNRGTLYALVERILALNSQPACKYQYTCVYETGIAASAFASPQSAGSARMPFCPAKDGWSDKKKGGQERDYSTGHRQRKEILQGKKDLSCRQMMLLYAPAGAAGMVLRHPGNAA